VGPVDIFGAFDCSAHFLYLYINKKTVSAPQKKSLDSILTIIKFAVERTNNQTDASAMTFLAMK
jgi:hypothetical protein